MTATDRCDRCGAQAYLRADYLGGSLLFCAHHARQHRDALLRTASAIVDETAELVR